MVDYDFLTNGETSAESKKIETIKEPTIRKLMPGEKVVPANMGPGRVEFMDIDLPEKTKGAVDLVRHKMIEGDQRIQLMKKEADALAVKDDETFVRASEMIGQTKNLKKFLEDAVNEIIKPLYQEYKKGRNILTERTGKLDAIIKAIQGKADAHAYKLEMQRREEERKAREAAAKLQAELDKAQRAAEAAERKAAKAEKRDPVKYEPIVVDTPVVPKEIKLKTESSSAKIEMVLVPTIEDPKAEYVIDKILYYFESQFMDLALKAAIKAIKAGAIGLKGAPGIKVEEKAVTRHRRR